MKDDDEPDWSRGVVVSLEPLKVKLDGGNRGFSWDSVRKVNNTLFHILQTTKCEI